MIVDLHVHNSTAHICISQIFYYMIKYITPCTVNYAVLQITFAHCSCVYMCVYYNICFHVFLCARLRKVDRRTQMLPNYDVALVGPHMAKLHVLISLTLATSWKLLVGAMSSELLLQEEKQTVIWEIFIVFL